MIPGSQLNAQLATFAVTHLIVKEVARFVAAYVGARQAPTAQMGLLPLETGAVAHFERMAWGGPMHQVFHPKRPFAEDDERYQSGVCDLIPESICLPSTTADSTILVSAGSPMPQEKSQNVCDTSGCGIAGLHRQYVASSPGDQVFCTDSLTCLLPGYQQDGGYVTQTAEFPHISTGESQITELDIWQNGVPPKKKRTRN